MWWQLSERLLVAMVGLVLGDEDKIWLTVELLEMRDAWLGLLVRNREVGVDDYGGADEPRIDENVESLCPREEAGGGGWGGRGIKG